MKVMAFVTKTRPLIKVLWEGISFIALVCLGFVLVSLGFSGGKKILGQSGPGLAHADAPYSQATYYTQSGYSCGTSDSSASSGGESSASSAASDGCGCSASDSCGG